MFTIGHEHVSTTTSQVSEAKTVLNRSWRNLRRALKSAGLPMSKAREFHAGRCLLGRWQKARDCYKQSLAAELAKLSSTRKGQVKPDPSVLRMRKLRAENKRLRRALSKRASPDVKPQVKPEVSSQPQVELVASMEKRLKRLTITARVTAVKMALMEDSLQTSLRDFDRLVTSIRRASPHHAYFAAQVDEMRRDLGTLVALKDGLEKNISDPIYSIDRSPVAEIFSRPVSNWEKVQHLAASVVDNSTTWEEGTVLDRYPETVRRLFWLNQRETPPLSVSSYALTDRSHGSFELLESCVVLLGTILDCPSSSADSMVLNIIERAAKGQDNPVAETGDGQLRLSRAEWTRDLLLSFGRLFSTVAVRVVRPEGSRLSLEEILTLLESRLVFPSALPSGDPNYAQLQAVPGYQIISDIDENLENLELLVFRELLHSTEANLRSFLTEALSQEGLGRSFQPLKLRMLAGDFREIPEFEQIFDYMFG